LFTSLELDLQLFRIYLTDDSEKANLSAIDAIAHAFNADSGALFYVNAANAHRFCLAGSQFPIEISVDRWRECVDRHTRPDAVDTFGDWAPPGMDMPVSHWMSSPLYSSGSGFGFAFLGRNGEPWVEAETASFKSITDTISEIVAARYRKEIEAGRREETERQLAESLRRFTAFFESAHDMIYTMNASGVITNINAAGLRLLGIPDKDEALGHRLRDLVENGDFHDFFDQKLAHDGYVVDLEVILKRKDGTGVYCIETSHALKDEDGSILEIQGTIKDISDRIKNERDMWNMNLELADMNMRLTQAQDLMLQHEKLASIGQLAAGIAHEINNPLGFLKSNQTMLKSYVASLKEMREKVSSLGIPEVEAIARSYDSVYLFDEATHIFGENEEGFNRIKNIITNLMSFSRMESTASFEDYDVNAGIESTLVVAWNELKYVADVTKEFDGVPRVPAHGGEINQVILNILVNAAQAIGEQKRSEKGHINLKTFVEGAYVVLLISDDGPGIPKSVLSRIFDPFFTTKEPGKGTGLGLSISYDIIVNKHGGRLSAESEPGRGTTFRIELPIARSA
jgi:PAS domain S-box-containing protein